MCKGRRGTASHQERTRRRHEMRTSGVHHTPWGPHPTRSQRLDSRDSSLLCPLQGHHRSCQLPALNPLSVPSSLCSWVLLSPGFCFSTASACRDPCDPSSVLPLSVSFLRALSSGSSQERDSDPPALSGQGPGSVVAARGRAGRVGRPGPLAVPQGWYSYHWAGIMSTDPRMSLHRGWQCR